VVGKSVIKEGTDLQVVLCKTWNGTYNTRIVGVVVAVNYRFKI